MHSTLASLSDIEVFFSKGKKAKGREGERDGEKVGNFASTACNSQNRVQWTDR